MPAMKPQHLKQLTIVTAIGLVALACGAIVKVQAAKNRPAVTLVTPSPTPTLESSSVAKSVPTVVKYSPTPALASSKYSVSFVSPSPRPSVAAAPIKRQNFTWGITLRPLPFPDNNDKLLPEQFKASEQLGLSMVRVEYSTTNTVVNSRVLSEAKKHNQKVVFVLPYGPNDIFTDKQLDQNTYNYVAKVIKKYKGQVPVWQLGNEVGSVALNPNGNYMGIDQGDYPEDRYRAVTTWLKAAARAVRDNDPSAKILITDAWIHTGFFDRFMKDDADFDILGWDWYSIEGGDINTVMITGSSTGPYRLMTKLATYKKPIWFAEVSRHLGSYGENENDREKEQADFIQETAEQALENQQVTGFFVYDLIQDQTLAPNLRAFSLLNVDHETHQITGRKQAFERYRAIIKNWLNSQNNGLSH